MQDNWFGTVPHGWKVKQCRHLFKIHSGATPKSSEPDYWGDEVTWITPEDLGNNLDKKISDSRRKISEVGFRNCGAQMAPAGSIALSTRAPIGHIAVTTVPACVNQGCRLLEPKEGDLNYWYYALNAAKQILISRGQGTTFMELPRQSIASVKLVSPPLEIQHAIADFLDFKTGQIDSLIAKQKLLLEKLAEKRTSLISHAVTKGLDPTVATKDSGVDWIGEIPAHWDVWKLTHGFRRIGSGTTPNSDNPNFYDGTIPWVTTSELRESVIVDTAQKVTEEAVLSNSALKIYPAGSLAIAMYGATIGRLGILGVNATFNQACCVFSDPEVFDLRFVYYWLWMRRPILVSLSSGGGQPNLSQDDLKQIRIPIPDPDEQREIVQYLDKKTFEVDEHASKVREAVAKLLEYRSSLITNAVTGKIDVRGFELPQLTEELAS